MDRILSLQDMQDARKEALEQEAATAADRQFQIRVSLGSCGIAAGANETLEAIEQVIRENELMRVQTKIIGCLGMCALEPIVQVIEADLPPVTYGKVSPSVVQRIFKEHLEKHHIVHEYVVDNI